MLGDVVFRVGGDVGAVVAVLRKGNRLLALEVLKVAGLERLGKLLDLVACVVDQKLAGAAKACPVERRGKSVANRAAPALPICIGPVGLAETNSTITFLPSP